MACIICSGRFGKNENSEIAMRVAFASFFGLALLCAARADDRPAYRVLAQDKGHVAIVNAKGEVEWEVACAYNSHDIALLANGNLLLHTGPAKVVEMTPEKKIVWEYESKPKPGY